LQRATVPNQPATPNRTVRISDELWEAALAKAAAEGITVTDVIRHALERFLRD
jgi:predicted DNA binding CopG/RHH family protein